MASQPQMPSLQLKEPSQYLELSFESKRLGTIISFSPEVVKHFVEYRQEGKIKSEIGGQLFAEFVKNEVRVVRATGPHATDKRGWSWFRPDKRKQNIEIKQLFKDGMHFVGDWHTHPEPEPNPSSLDLASMEDCFKKSRHQLNAFVMVIVGQVKPPKGLWVSLHGPEKWERLALVIASPEVSF